MKRIVFGLAITIFVVLARLSLCKRLPIDIGIDGNPHHSWDAAHIALRKPLGNIVARMYFPPEQPISFMDQHVLVAVRDVQCRIHALIGRTEYDVDANAYAIYAVQVVRRFGPKGTFWNEHPEINRKRFSIKTVELMNEPYYIPPLNPTKYSDQVKPALLAIKRLKSGVGVILGSMTRSKKKGGNVWIDTLYRRIPKLNSLIVGFVSHPYWYGHAPNTKKAAAGRPFSVLDTLRASMNCHGAQKKGIYITEYGQSTAYQSPGGQGVTEALQAKHLNTFFKAVTKNTYGWNVRMALVYTIQDWGSPVLTERESMFGILRGDRTRKPSYAVMKKYFRVKSIPSRPLKSSVKGKKILGVCKKWTR